MAALDAEVRARYSTQYLVNLTQPDDASATSEDTARMDAAVTDTQADFAVEVGLEYEAANTAHIVIGVEGVIVHLLERTGRGEKTTRERYDRYIERLRSLRSRILPGTTSKVIPTPERGNPVRPIFDSPRFDGVNPDAPHGATSIGE
tara:strand:+ start:63 stop:503 length:441 start_codon:yes stop_codon:yes gene_type:complete